MNAAEFLCLSASGVFLLTGLITGVWKYAGLLKDPERGAHYYVDTAHRAALMYSFAALVLWKFAELSPFSPQITFWAAAMPLFFFAFAIVTYCIHGFLKDAENQFLKPHKLGTMNLPPFLFHGAMALLIIAEIGGFAVLFWGFVTNN